MKTPEQQARDMLTRMGVKDAQSWNAGDVVELADLIAKYTQEQKRAKAAHRLLERALDTIPSFIDGRHDRLTNAIEKWLNIT